MELLTRGELAKRWKMSLDSIDDMRSKGIIKKIPRITCIRFNLEHIEAIEGTTLTKFPSVERKRLENEINDLRQKVKSYDLIVTSIMKAATNIMTDEQLYLHS